MDLQTLLKRLALDRQELAESEERVLQMIASTEDRMAKMLETQSNQQRDFSQMMKNHVALTQSQSKLGEVVLGLSAEIAKMAAQQEATKRSDTAARQVHLQTVASPFDAKTNSPISQDSNAEAHFLADSALYGFDRPVPKRLTNSVEKRDYGQQKTRRESSVISDMKYNISRAEQSNVYKMVTNDPFTKKLVKLEMSSFIAWYTLWNDHMVLSKTYTEPTNLVSTSIREILCENNGLSLRDFHALEPDDFIYLVSKELKIRTKKEFHEQMMESYGAMPKIYFRESSGVEAHTEFYVALLARKNYFRKCLELLSIHSAAFCPMLKGEKGLVRIFTSTLELSYVKDVQDEMGNTEEYDGITSYLSAFCQVAQVHLDLAKNYSRVPMAFGDSKKQESNNPAPTAHASHVRVDKNQDCTHDSSGVLPKESWQARRAPNVGNGTTAKATAGRDVNAWVETVPRRYGQHEQDSYSDSNEDEDY